MKRKHVAGMMMMGGRAVPNVPTPAPSGTANPIQVLGNFPALVETSIVDQDQTIYRLTSTGIISRPPTARKGRRNLDYAVRPAFGVIATIMVYAPGKTQPITAYDFAGATPDGRPGERRSYTKLYQIKFGRGFHVASFLLNGIPPVDGTQSIVFKHAPCRRRAILGDQIVNVLEKDKVSTNSSRGRGDTNINSDSTDPTDSPKELIYGAIAIGGKFTNYISPPDYIPIGIAESNIDDFDVSLRTYYKLTATTGSYRISASGVGQFVWGAGVQTFKAFDI